jgi:hypothetical protein
LIRGPLGCARSSAGRRSGHAQGRPVAAARRSTRNDG